MPMSAAELRQLDRKDMEAVVQVQQRMMGVALGNTPMEYPGAPQAQPGSRYQPNTAENEFISRSRTILYGNLFKYSLLMGGGPYLISTLRFRVNPKLKQTTFNRPRFWGIIGLFFGSMYGTTIARVEIAKENIRLENSPLATEARYQLWKLNPNHPFLRGFEYEFEQFSTSNYNNQYNNNQYNPYPPPMTPQGHPNHTRQSHSLPPPPYRYPTPQQHHENGNRSQHSQSQHSPQQQGYSQSDINNENINDYDSFSENEMKRKRRERFYRNKSNYDRHDDEADVSSFFESTNPTQNRGNNSDDEW